MHHSTLSKGDILSAISYAGDGRFILFVGVCGTGMSALCRLLFHRGVGVLGYDDSCGGEYRTLVREGVPFLLDTNADLQRCSLIVYSLAIDEEHPLLQNTLPRCSRAQLLGAVMEDYPIRIAIAGSHGKSTVTALVHRLLTLSGKNPTTLCGAELGEGEGTLHIGGREYFLYECCEYRDSFLYTAPTHAVLLNLELDHTDYFADLEAIKESFLRFANLSENVLYAAFDDNLSELIPRCRARCYSLCFDERGIEGDADFWGMMREKRDGCYCFDFCTKNSNNGIYVKPEIVGRVGAINTLFALSLTTILDISPFETVKYVKYLAPIGRRMSKIGLLDNHAVYYDFAHHPTEIRASLETLKELYGIPPCVVFAPHTYSRTRDLWDAFVDALSPCHRVFVCPIYAAREDSVPGVSSEALARAIGNNAATVSKLCDLSLLCEGGAIVLMGAGDLTIVKEKIENHPAFVREKEK